MTDYFQGFIGQPSVKRKLSYYLDAHKATSRLPFLMLSAARGIGKTSFARQMAKNICNRDGSKRPFVELNCSVLKNTKTFFENIFLQFLHENDAVVLFDECHNLPHDLEQALLTICNSDPDPVRSFTWENGNFVFNFCRLSFIFATTEPDKIFPPLKDRLEVIEFEEYSKDDLRKIVCGVLDAKGGQNITTDAMDLVVPVVRGNPRAAVKIGEHIKTFLVSKGCDIFTAAHWKDVSHQLGILPQGLSNAEVQVLRELDKRGDCSLQMLSSATGFSRSALQKSIECFLLKKGFMVIDGKRKITHEGRSVLAEIKEVLS